MPDYVSRSAFFEGQVLSAADLNLTVSYERDALARHLRQHHTWGIVTGLELTTADRTSTAGGTTKPYVEVTLAPGVAVDGTGRTIVVTEPTRVPEEFFEALGVAIDDPAAWYPVFLEGSDAATTDASGPMGACAAPAPNRVNEAFLVTFDRIAAVASLDSQQPVEVSDGPGGAATNPWKILLGFVQWDDSIRRFTKVADAADGVRRRYAGVRAGEVIGAAGALVLRSGERDQSGAAAVQLTSGAKSLMEVGPQNASGEVSALMTLDTDGNLTVKGKIVGALAGGVQVESGIVTDGMLLPLPPGITQEQIDAGEVVIQTLVSPRWQIPTGFPDAQKWFPHFYECRIDDSEPGKRRVRCRVRWISTAAAPPPPQDFPGACDYVLMAFPGKKGA